MESVLLVIIDWNNRDGWFVEDMETELKELVRTSRAEVVDVVACRRDKPTPKYFIGKGKVQEIAARCKANNVDVVVFNDDLTSSQQRNLEDAFEVKVIDRTQLILDIFALHAKTQEGKVQVERAQLEYLLPRLVGKGIVLSRLGGGIGTRGPGEQKLEVDRRRIHERIANLKTELRQLEKRRESLRRKRTEHFIPTVAIIGYTNVGKSTLLNALTDSHVVARDELFSTLDPITRRFILPDNQKVVFSDTVGFLHKLPHNLIEAFKATLQEVSNADILLHVLDISHPRIIEHNEAIFEVLKELKAENKPIVYALNKIDKLENDILITRYQRCFNNAVAVSALKTQGLDTLIGRVQSMLNAQIKRIKVFIPHNRMDLVQVFYKEGKIFSKEHNESGIIIDAQLPEVIAKKVLTSLKTVC
ncbi:MAG: GTPase HflX [Candidatus Omnitrophota bacterium]